MLNAFKEYWINYFNFKGRASKSDFWWAALCNLIILFFLMFLASNKIFTSGIVIYLFITLIPNISISVRRLHDTNQSGWMVLTILIPLIGLYFFIMYTVVDGDSETNKYGKPTKKSKKNKK